MELVGVLAGLVVQGDNVGGADNAGGVEDVKSFEEIGGGFGYFFLFIGVAAQGHVVAVTAIGAEPLDAKVLGVAGEETFFQDDTPGAVDHERAAIKHFKAGEFGTVVD